MKLVQTEQIQDRSPFNGSQEELKIRNRYFINIYWVLKNLLWVSTVMDAKPTKQLKMGSSLKGEEPHGRSLSSTEPADARKSSCMEEIISFF